MHVRALLRLAGAALSRRLCCLCCLCCLPPNVHSCFQMPSLWPLSSFSWSPSSLAWLSIWAPPPYTKSSQAQRGGNEKIGRARLLAGKLDEAGGVVKTGLLSCEGRVSSSAGEVCWRLRRTVTTPTTLYYAEDWTQKQVVFPRAHTRGRSALGDLHLERRILLQLKFQLQ